MIKPYIILSLMLLSLTGRGQDFIISHGDTINRLDSMGRRQGLWAMTNSWKVKIAMRFKNDIPSDTVTFYEKDSLRLIYVRTGPDTIYYTYQNGKFSCHNFLSDTINYCSSQAAVRAQIRRFILYEMRPSYYGGDTAMRVYLRNKVRGFPAGLRGRVMVSFTLDEAGRTTDVHIKTSDNPKLNRYCISAIEDMPRWQPGYQRGYLVKVPMTLPIVK